MYFRAGSRFYVVHQLAEDMAIFEPLVESLQTTMRPVTVTAV